MDYVYVLKSKVNQKLYIGATSYLKRRLDQHNRGEVSSTKINKPYQLIYSESFERREMALKRERFLKTGKGREVLKNLIKE